MPKVIDQAVKTQIIELYKQGRGRNDIAEAPSSL